MYVAHISNMHCSLPVISLLTCCQKEVLKACTCLYSQAARHSGILPPPPPPGDEHFLAYKREVCNRYSNYLLVHCASTADRIAKVYAIVASQFCIASDSLLHYYIKFAWLHNLTNAQTFAWVCKLFKIGHVSYHFTSIFIAKTEKKCFAKEQTFAWMYKTLHEKHEMHKYAQMHKIYIR